MPAPRKWDHPSASVEYSTWWDMHSRCYNPTDPSYKRYGAQGIRVCQRWHDFDNFVKDVGLKPDGLTLDRIDNDGDYEPGNWRWATQLVQARNRRSNTLITYKDKTQCIAAWAEETGLSHRTIQARLANGLPIDRVLSTDDLRKQRHG